MAVPPDADLAVLAEVQGVLIEVLEMRNSELSEQVACLEERLARLARLERLVSRNSGDSSMSGGQPSNRAATTYPPRRRSPSAFTPATCPAYAASRTPGIGCTAVTERVTRSTSRVRAIPPGAAARRRA